MADAGGRADLSRRSSGRLRPLAKANKIVSAGIVETSGLVEDNQWILDLVKVDGFYSFHVGNLEIGATTFAHDLERFSEDSRWVGIRGYLTGPPEGITRSPAQLASLHDLARRGMTLDIISRGTKNPKDHVHALCAAVPDLRVIIDHLGGAKGVAAWEREMRGLADVCPNLHMKFSSFYDMHAPGDVVFPAPMDLAHYKAHFDVLMAAFGPDRLIWGSNWPVVRCTVHNLPDSPAALRNRSGSRRNTWRRSAARSATT